MSTMKKAVRAAKSPAGVHVSVHEFRDGERIIVGYDEITNAYHEIHATQAPAWSRGTGWEHELFSLDEKAPAVTPGWGGNVQAGVRIVADPADLPQVLAEVGAPLDEYAASVRRGLITTLTAWSRALLTGEWTEDDLRQVTDVEDDGVHITHVGGTATIGATLTLAASLIEAGAPLPETITVTLDDTDLTPAQIADVQSRVTQTLDT